MLWDWDTASEVLWVKKKDGNQQHSLQGSFHCCPPPTKISLPGPWREPTVGHFPDTGKTKMQWADNVTLWNYLHLTKEGQSKAKGACGS